MDNCFIQIWNTLKENDIPNWIILIFTGVVWPIFLYYWHRRSINNISGLEVRFKPGNIMITGTPHDAIGIEFINHTGSVVYLNDAWITKCTKSFIVPLNAGMDTGEGAYHLKFLDHNNGFTIREATIQTNNSANTCIAVEAKMGESFYRHKSKFPYRLFKRPKYFIIKYIAIVGNKRHKIETVY